MSRQLDLAKKVSLAGVASGWGEECYAMMLPATYQDMLTVDDIDTLSKSGQVKFQIEFCKKHFVSGKVRLPASPEPVDMEPDDVSASIAIADRLFLGCIGDGLDPKEVRQAAEQANRQDGAGKPTVTPSSTEANASPDVTPGS